MIGSTAYKYLSMNVSEELRFTNQIRKCNVKTYTLIKLSEPSPGYAGVVPPVDLCYVVPLDVADLVHGAITGKRNS